MSDMPEADWPGEWPLRVYILHPDVKNFGDMVTAPERREYIRADKVAALRDALKFYADTANYEIGWQLAPCGCCSDAIIRITADEGHKARIALAALDAKP